ncbi:hypothetical protein WME98_35460 [Sorangium sp. So ce296]|uniref:hypothetical protein n=1 Tax=Sorangium sp. So ce296 TaxID=3133296 RepID=UPI003F607016
MTLKSMTFTAICGFLALAGCDGTLVDAGGTGGTGGTGGASSSSGTGGTGGASSSSGAGGTGGASSSSGAGGIGGASSSSGAGGIGGASSSSGVGGTGGASSSSGTGGDTAGCPEDLPPDPLEACSTSEKCVYDGLYNGCANKVRVEASCVEGEWHVLWPVTCEPLPASLKCDPFGTWLVEPGEFVGDGVETLSLYGGPFKVSVSVGENGLVYLLNHKGWTLSADGCLLDVFTAFPLQCIMDEGEVFCDAFRRDTIIDFSKMPPEASIRVTVEGEASGEATATATVTKEM